MRAIITSGGGAKGAFTVGALIELKRRGLDKFDFVSGTSTGALMAGMLAIDKLEVLENIYSNINTDDILTQQNIISNLTSNKPYLFDTTPLENIIDQYITHEAFEAIMASETILSLTAISLQTGRITAFTTKEIPSTDKYDTRLITDLQMLKNAMLASSNQAAFLPPVKIGNEQFVDGGNREVIPSRIVIDQNPDDIFVLSNNPLTLVKGKDNYEGFLDVLTRAIAIFVTEIRANDLELLANFGKRDGKKVITIEPDRDLDPENSTGLRFDQDLMIGWMRKGELTAENVLEENEFLMG